MLITTRTQDLFVTAFTKDMDSIFGITVILTKASISMAKETDSAE